MSVSEFLKDLPTHNRDNFTRLHSDGNVGPGGSLYSSRNHVTTRHRPTVYVPTKDIPADQVIVTEKTNILLRYLHQQWDKKDKNAQRKREMEAAAAARGEGDDAAGGPSRKKARLDPLPNGNNQQASPQMGNGISPPSSSSNPPGPSGLH